jgi:hypothetical protein
MINKFKNKEDKAHHTKFKMKKKEKFINMKKKKSMLVNKYQMKKKKYKNTKMK